MAFTEKDGHPSPLKLKSPALSLDYAVLTLSTFLAWLPLIRSYIPVSDDYHYAAVLRDKGLLGYFQLYGAYRLIGHPVDIIVSIYSHPLSFGIFSVFAHAVTVCLFFRTCQFLLKDTPLSFFLSLLTAIFPWGYQAMAWAVAQNNVLATLFFWANLLVLIQFSSQRHKQKLVFLISFCLTWLSLLSHECLLFSLAMSGAIVWINQGKLNFQALKQKLVRNYSGWAPFLASLSYVVFYYFCFRYVTSEPPTRQLVWNPETLLSTYFYQWSHIYLFQPWFNSITRELIFYSWGSGMFVACGFLFLSFGICLYFLVRSLSEGSASALPANNALLFYLLALMLGVSLIYAVSGGYALDTRKKYALIPFMLLFLGYLYRRFLESRIKVPAKRSILLILCLLGVSTTWLHLGIWRHTTIHYNSLTDFLVANNISGNIHVKWQPDLHVAWPAMSEMLGVRWDDNLVLNFAIIHKGGRPVRVTQDQDVKTVWYDPMSSRWRVENPQEDWI